MARFDIGIRIADRIVERLRMTDLPPVNPLTDRYKAYCVDRVSGIASLEDALTVYASQLPDYVTDTENLWTLRQAIDYARSFDDAIRVLDAVWQQREFYPSRHAQRQSALRCAITHATTLEDWARFYNHPYLDCIDPTDMPAADDKVRGLLLATTDWDRLWSFYLAVPDRCTAKDQAWLRIQDATTGFDQAFKVWNHDQPPTREVGGWAWYKMNTLATEMSTFDELMTVLELFSGGHTDRNLPAILEQMSIKATTLEELLFTYNRVRHERMDIVDRVVTRLRELICRIDNYAAAVAARQQVESIKPCHSFGTVRHVAMARCVELAPDYDALRQSYSLTLTDDRTTRLYRERLVALSSTVQQVVTAFDDFVRISSIHDGRLASGPYIARVIELAQTPDDWALITSHSLLYQCCDRAIRDQIMAAFDAALTAAGYPPAETPPAPPG